MCKSGRITGATQPWPGGPWLIPTKIVIVLGKPGPKQK
jgi:hypothetical protein